MRYETQTVRVGEYVGPVDWEHETAKDMPDHWRDAEKHPENYRFNYNGGFTDREIVRIGMYDGWPYWEPRPALLVIGPLGPEWTHFNSYGVSGRSVFPTPPQGQSE